MTDEPLADNIDLEPDLPPGQVPEEDALKHRSVKRTAVAQGSKIPLGWKPTLREPLPVVRCNYIFKDHHARAGEQCNKWSLRGSLLCFTHSGRGNLKHVPQYREALLESARLQLLDSAPEAVNVIVDLMLNSGADAVRLKAAESVLDRNGVKMPDQMDVRMEVTQTDPAAVLAERLGKLKDAADKIASARAESRLTQALALTSPEPQDGEDIVDAEVVDDTPSPEEG